MSIAIDYSNTAKTKVVETTPIHTKDGGSQLVVINVGIGQTPEVLGYRWNVAQEYVVGGCNNTFLNNTADKPIWGIFVYTSDIDALIVEFGELGSEKLNGRDTIDLIFYYNQECATTPVTATVTWDDTNKDYRGPLVGGSAGFTLANVGDTLEIEFK